jgi:hypothetical protein
VFLLSWLPHCPTMTKNTKMPTPNRMYFRLLGGVGETGC